VYLHPAAIVMNKSQLPEFVHKEVHAALCESVPFANGAPNLTVDIPALQGLSRRNKAPICGKDFKSGQTLMKKVLAPGLKACMLPSGTSSRRGEPASQPTAMK